MKINIIKNNMKIINRFYFNNNINKIDYLDK